MGHPSATLVIIGIFLSVLAAARLEAATPCAPGSVTQSGISAERDRPATDALTIGSLNIHGRPHIVDDVVRWTRLRTLDVLLLQEVGHRMLNGAALGSAISQRLGFHFAYAPANALDGGQTQGLAIVSRYPLSDVRVRPLTYNQLRFKSRCRIALEAPSSPRLARFAWSTFIWIRESIAGVAWHS